MRALIRPPSSSARLAGTTVQWVQGTFEDLDSLERLVGDADVVVHCAGAVRGITEADFFQANVEAVARLAHLASSRNPAPRFLLISSLAAREPNLSPYAASKRMGEIALTKVGDRLTWTVLRPPAVYGPGDREMLPLLRLMLRGIAPVVGGSDARFSMLYVDDLADAVVKWLASDSRENRVFELDDGHPGGYSWCEIVETVERLRGKGVVRVRVPGPVLNLAARLNTLAASIIGYRPMLTLGKVRELRHPDWVCDNSIYYRVANWAPTVRLEEGLRYTLGLSASPAIGTRA